MPKAPADTEKLAATDSAAVTTSSETAVITPIGAASGPVIVGLTARIVSLEIAVADLSNRSFVRV